MSKVKEMELNGVEGEEERSFVVNVDRIGRHDRNLSGFWKGREARTERSNDGRL
jgi:hypothetical protein